MGASPSSGVVTFARADQTLGGAVTAFLAQPDLAASTRRSYQQTLDRLERALGRDQSPATITTNQVTAAVTAAWDRCAPATWNRHVATVRSFTSYCRRRRWLTDDLAAGLDRRVEPADRTKAIPLPQLEQLWRRDDIAVREKALWRFLYETAARATEALSINIEDLDLDNKRVRVRSKGGDLDWLHFQTGSARLLPRLIAGRTGGPLFLADRTPAPTRAPAAIDRCPQTGRARLSYRRAEALFRHASGGWTLHQLRHSALTHLAEQNVSLPLLMAKSRHASLQSLQRYARPGAEAVARSPQLLIPPDGAADLDKSWAQPGSMLAVYCPERCWTSLARREQPAKPVTRAVGRFEPLTSSVRDLCWVFSQGTAWC